MKKILISVLMLCSMIGLTFAQDSNQDVVSWLYYNGLTKYESTNSFRPYDSITRGEAAKFMVEYAQMQNMTKIKSAQECQFSDIANYDSTLRPYIVQACEYGIFKGSNGKYFPNNNITKGEAIAVVMRTIIGVQDETQKPRYLSYYSLAQTWDMSVESIGGFDQKINRISIGTWVREAFYHKDNGFNVWGGEHYHYNLTTIKDVLQGNGQSCEMTMKQLNNHHYECNNSKYYRDSLTLINYLENNQYSHAAALINQNSASMLPQHIAVSLDSSCVSGFGGMGYCISVKNLTVPEYFIPYKNGILGFIRRHGGDSVYNLTYITISKGRLHILYSNNHFYYAIESVDNSVNIKSYLNWYDPNMKEVDRYDINLASSCYSSDPYSTNHYECLKSYFGGVLNNKIDDINTKSRIDAMKKKVDQWSK